MWTLGWTHRAAWRAGGATSSRPPDPLERRPQRAPAEALARLAGVFLLLFLPAGAVGVPRTLATATALAVLQVGLLVLIMLHDSSRARFRWRPRWRDAVEAFLIAAAILAVLLLVTLLVGALPEHLSRPLLRGFRWELEGTAQVPLALGFVLVGAYREELFFRAYCLTLLEEIATPAWLAVLATALLFSLGHLYQGWLAAAVALLLGSFLALLYQRRHSVHRLAWAHALFNAVVLTGSLFAA